jgi:hypothetical protein
MGTRFVIPEVIIAQGSAAIEAFIAKKREEEKAKEQQLIEKPTASPAKQPPQTHIQKNAAIISDIHGNLSALEAALTEVRIAFRSLVRKRVLREAERTSRTPKEQLLKDKNFVAALERHVLAEVKRIGWPEVYCLGDVVGYDLQTIEVLTKALEFTGCCKGNHDETAWNVYNGATPEALHQFLGIAMGSGAAETLYIAGNQVHEIENPEERERLAGFLRSLAEDTNRIEVRIRDDARGIHAFSIDGKLRYPLSPEMARKYGIPMKKYTRLCTHPGEMLRDKKMREERVFPDGIKWRFTGHSHIPVIAIWDDDRQDYMSFEPMRGEDTREDYLIKVQLNPKQRAFINVGSCGSSRRKDKDIIKRARQSNLNLDCGYFGMLSEDTFYAYEFFYDPTKTRQETRKVRKEWQES